MEVATVVVGEVSTGCAVGADVVVVVVVVVG